MPSYIGKAAALLDIANGSAQSALVLPGYDELRLTESAYLYWFSVKWSSRPFE